MIEPTVVKKKSEAVIIAALGKICDSLPTIDTEDLTVRDARAVAERALALNALVNLAFGAPKEFVATWLLSNGLRAALSPKEQALLAKPGPVSESERNQLHWSLESIWSIAWIASLSEELTVTGDISRQLAGFFPKLRAQEPAEPFFVKVSVRNMDQLYEKLDLFYRAHWYARDCRIKGVADTSFNEGIMLYRRKPLEWVLHAGVGWDNVDVST
jgi:hypothetical protein